MCVCMFAYIYICLCRCNCELDSPIFSQKKLKRYVTSSWAPTKLAWSIDNRTAGFRVVGRVFFFFFFFESFIYFIFLFSPIISDSFSLFIFNKIGTTT